MSENVSEPLEQKPLRQVLDFKLTSDGDYEFQFPSSVCYGVVVSGGVVMAAIHRAAANFVAKDPPTSSHSHVMNVSLQFHRPTLPAQKTVIIVTLGNVSRASTTLHVKVMQKKACVVGYITMTNLSVPGYSWQPPTPRLSPAPIPTSIQSLESDRDTNWVGYHSPLDLCGTCQVQSYVRIHIPQKEETRHRSDAWMTTGWHDDDLPNGAVWTNELVHFVLDNGLPPLYADLMHQDKTRMIYDRFVTAGLAQRQARLNGESDRIRGEGLNEADFVPYSLATLAVSTEVKKLLPPEGTKWLFMRSQTRGIRDNRFDLDITLLDIDGDVVAISHHIALLIPLSGKHARL